MLNVLLGLAVAGAAPEVSMAPGLEPLGFLVGHCWRGQVDGRDEVDVHCFESVWGGKHVRDRHEVKAGATVYNGETLYSWDAGRSRVAYTYWNSLGGVRHGWMTPAAGSLDFTNDQGQATASWFRDAPDSYRAESRIGEGPPRAVVFKRID